MDPGEAYGGIGSSMMVRNNVQSPGLKLRLLVLMCGLVFATQAAARESVQREVQIATGHSPPITSSEEADGGFIPTLIKEAFARENTPVRFVFLPWKRAYEDSLLGKYDATAYWRPSAERAREFLYSAPLFAQPQYFFFRKDNPLRTWSDLDDLRAFVIGATGGFTYTPEFWQAEKSGRLQIEVVMEQELNLAKLMRGRIDLYPGSKASVMRLLRTHYSVEQQRLIDFHPKPLVSSTLHLLFPDVSPRSPVLLERFNEGLQKLHVSGRYRELLTAFKVEACDDVQISVLGILPPTESGAGRRLLHR